MSSPDGSRNHAYSRKKKSLGLLCSNFINLYNREGVKFIGLDKAASQLGVERRRIYDIVNVLEIVGVLSRKAMNQYFWKGFAGIPQALDELRVLDDDENEGLFDWGSEKRRKSKSNPNSDLEAPPFCRLSSKSKAAKNRREKSLGILTQNFLKLFLNTKTSMVSLDEAASFLLGDIHGLSQTRTKLRRLYDIANVLASLNLIEKTNQTESKKPAYRWLGFEGRTVNKDLFSSRSPDPQQLKRKFGTDITNREPVMKSKLNSSAHEKPIEIQMKQYDSLAQRDCSQMEKQHQQSSKGCVFGEPTGSHNKQRKSVKINEDCKSLASSHRPEYHNQALNDLFAHYMEAWKSWYAEVARGNSLSQKALHRPS